MRAARDIQILKSLVNIEWGIFSQDFELSSRILNLDGNLLPNKSAIAGAEELREAFDICQTDLDEVNNNYIGQAEEINN